VAGHHRLPVHRQVATADLEVGAADGAGADADGDLAGAGLGLGQVDPAQGGALGHRSRQLHRAHGGSLPGAASRLG
jgi:hypothetical protein